MNSATVAKLQTGIFICGRVSLVVLCDRASPGEKTKDYLRDVPVHPVDFFHSSQARVPSVLKL